MASIDWLSMVSRLAALALVLVICGSVFAGVPLHSNEQECGMPEMAGIAARRRLRPGPSPQRFQPRGYAARWFVRRVEPQVRPEPNSRARLQANRFQFISHLSNPQFYYRRYRFVQGGKMAPLHIPIPLTFDISHF